MDTKARKILKIWKTTSQLMILHGVSWPRRKQVWGFLLLEPSQPEKITFSQVLYQPVGISELMCVFVYLVHIGSVQSFYTSHPWHLCHTWKKQAIQWNSISSWYLPGKQLQSVHMEAKKKADNVLHTQHACHAAGVKSVLQFHHDAIFCESGKNFVTKKYIYE